METLAALLSSFDVSPIYPVIGQIAKSVATFLTPVLLILAIYIRLMETQMDALVSQGKFGTAIKDILLWTFVLGAYFSIGNLIVDLFNPIYAWLDGFGSLERVMATFADLSEKNAELAKKQSTGNDLIGLLASPYLVGAAIFYYGTLIILAFLTAFLKIANVLIFGAAFVWGLIAIPISISTTFKILRGWAYLLAFALVWPIIQGLLLGMFTMLFTNSVNTMIEMSANTPVAESAQVIGANAMMLFAVMHLLMGAVMVAAPFIASALVSNAPAAAGIVMPFVGAAIAAGAGLAKITSASSEGAKNLFNKNTNNTNNTSSNKINSLNNGPQPRNYSNPSTTSGPSPVAGGGAGSGLNLDASGETSQADKSQTKPMPESPDKEKRDKQRRRGVLIRQQIKTRGKE